MIDNEVHPSCQPGSTVSDVHDRQSDLPGPTPVQPADNALVTVATASLPGAARALLGAHPGKLAIGVAATLGMMIYYNWRERQLAKKDPEGHARLQRLKARVRHDEKAGPAALPTPVNDTVPTVAPPSLRSAQTRPAVTGNDLPPLSGRVRA